MRTQSRLAVRIGLFVAMAVQAGACQSPQPGASCGDERCRTGELCALAEKATGVQLTCVIADVCGNGIQEVGEECDDGNLDDTDGCLSSCKRNTCGDGKVHLGTEECDDGNG